MADIETLIVGAGVVGLAIARALAMRGNEVMVLEQHPVIGSETSSRNSEVIHAGLYYPPGSLRAVLCVEGKAMLYRFCEDNGVPHSRISKLLVATHDRQLEGLANIKATAIKNGVNDLVELSGSAARDLEPELHCVRALLSPSTGIIDSHAFMQALDGHITSLGGQVVLNTPVWRVVATNDLFRLETGGMAAGTVTCRKLVISAGLSASKLARTITYSNGYQPPETYYAKGQYYALSGRSPFARHIYPMPDGAWLGLHATVDMGKRCKFGPDIEWIRAIDYTFRPDRLERSLDFIRRYYPALDRSRLHPDYTGIRPKLYRQGEPPSDFAIHGADRHGYRGLIALYGIESPGLTAALAIGEHVAAKL
jgi:L-2-hydroxyglutarate oxidase LhgO